MEVGLSTTVEFRQGYAEALRVHHSSRVQRLLGAWHQFRRPKTGQFQVTENWPERFMMRESFIRPGDELDII